MSPRPRASAFDVGSVRPTQAGGGGGAGISFADFQVAGPGWIDRQRYDIVADALSDFRRLRRDTREEIPVQMRFRFSSVFVLAAGLALAQKASFDVASVKAAAPQQDGRIMMRMGGDPGMVDYAHVSLRLLIQRAFGVKDFQVVAPDWASMAFFDVQAKLPPDTPQEKRNEMLRTLLEERFGLKVHRETREAPLYSLVVGKNGTKMKAVEAPPQPQPGAGPRRPPEPNPAGKATPGTIMMRMDGPGRMQLNAGAMQMTNFVDMLSRQVDRPVIDDTGLKGYYDVQLEFKPEGGGGMRGMIMMPRPDGGPGGPGGSGGPAPDAVEAPSIFTAVQDQLGLKLESKKGPIETIVVDHLEKLPIEN